MKDHNASTRGVQLLSPSLQRGLRATTTTTTSNRSSNQHAKTAVFDCDSFTLEAVRRRHDSERPRGHGSFLHASSGVSGVSVSSSGGSPRSPSMARSRHTLAKTGSNERLPSLDGRDTHVMDDFDWGTRSTHVSSYSSASQRTYQHLSSMSSVGTVSKRMSMASSSTSSAIPGMPRVRSEVVVRGWLQRRRGRVLKRWKTQYCVLKTDQRLCLYASEDTVNGRLEGRFHVLRVTYNDRHGSFQVIGIGSDETPYKDEFKPLDDDGWRVWFLALREFFTPASIHEALERMPELSLLPGVHASLLEDEDDDDDDEDDGALVHEVEEMILRPYGGGGDYTGVVGERLSVSNASTVSSNQHQHHRVHSYAGAGAGVGAGRDVPVSVSTPPPSANDRKTVLFDANEFPRYTTRSTNITNNQMDPDVATELPLRTSNYRKLYTGGVRSKSASIASTHSHSTEVEYSHSYSHSAEPSAAEVVMDCPMIERDSQNAMAILERCGSESIVSTATSRDSDSAFSWNRL